jgi:hypothetical protein
MDEGQGLVAELKRMMRRLRRRARDDDEAFGESRAPVLDFGPADQAVVAGRLSRGRGPSAAAGEVRGGA